MVGEISGVYYACGGPTGISCKPPYHPFQPKRTCFNGKCYTGQAVRVEHGHRTVKTATMHRGRFRAKVRPGRYKLVVIFTGTHGTFVSANSVVAHVRAHRTTKVAINANAS